MACGVSLDYNNIGAESGAALATALRNSPGALQRVLGVDLSKVDPHLPLELHGKDNGDVLNYYRDLLAATPVVSRRCRVMLLGTGGVGKTTLAHRLVTGLPATHSADVTHGVLQRTYTSTRGSYNCVAQLDVLVCLFRLLEHRPHCRGLCSHRWTPRGDHHGLWWASKLENCTSSSRGLVAPKL
jgi:hypothetical protein